MDEIGLWLLGVAGFLILGIGMWFIIKWFEKKPIEKKEFKTKKQ